MWLDQALVGVERTLAKLAGTGLDGSTLGWLAELVSQRTRQATARLATGSD